MPTHVTPYLCTKGAAAAITFYQNAFGATERYRLPNADGTIGHAELLIGDTTIYLADEAPALGVLSPATLGGTSCSFVIDVEDADAAVARAVAAGATVERPVSDAPYGRGGWVVDPFGHRWSLQTPNPNFKPEDMG